MKLNIDDTIEHLEAIGRPWKCVKEALEVCKMWRWFESSFAHYRVEYGCIGNVNVRHITEEAKAKYFKAPLTQTVVVELEGEDKQRLQSAIQTIECILAVKEVRPHETRY